MRRGRRGEVGGGIDEVIVDFGCRKWIRGCTKTGKWELSQIGLLKWYADSTTYPASKDLLDVGHRSLCGEIFELRSDRQDCMIDAVVCIHNKSKSANCWISSSWRSRPE